MRHPKPDKHLRNKTLVFRVSGAEHEQFLKEAERRHMELSEFFRHVKTVYFEFVERLNKKR